MVHVIEMQHIQTGLEIYINNSRSDGLWECTALEDGVFNTTITGLGNDPLDALENWIVFYNSKRAINKLPGERAGT